MKVLRTKAPAGLNNPSRWNQYLKPWFDAERFQARINDRVGLNKDGRPIVRLVWGQDVKQYLFGTDIPRYWLKRTAGQHPVYYTVARWIFEKRLEPEQYVDSWNATRYSIRDPSQGSSRCGDCGVSEQPVLLKGTLYCRNCTGTNIVGGAVVDKGPPPEEYYTFYSDCAVHERMTDTAGWPLCCSRAFYGDTQWGSSHSRCWGEYRAPNDFDLQVLSQSTRAMEASKFVDPYRPLSHLELFEAELASNKQVERADEQLRTLEAEITRDNINHFLRQPRSFDMGANGVRTPVEKELAHRAMSRIREAHKRKIS